jgi:hypothetical protein
VQNAAVVGDPTKHGSYTIRVKVPAGVKLMPRKHPEDRVYTVISGVFYIRDRSPFARRRASLGSLTSLASLASLHYAVSYQLPDGAPQQPA